MPNVQLVSLCRTIVGDSPPPQVHSLHIQNTLIFSGFISSRLKLHNVETQDFNSRYSQLATSHSSAWNEWHTLPLCLWGCLWNYCFFHCSKNRACLTAQVCGCEAGWKKISFSWLPGPLQASFKTQTIILPPLCMGVELGLSYWGMNIDCVHEKDSATIWNQGWGRNRRPQKNCTL
jgi:hypothetical protein